MSDISPVLRYSATTFKIDNRLGLHGVPSRERFDYFFSKNGRGSNSFTFGMQEQESSHNLLSNSDFCPTETQCTNGGRKLNYTVKERFSEKENIESNLEGIDYAQITNIRTLPPKYSDENDVRNNFISANNNIYIYAENKNGALDEQARISVSNNNVIAYSTIGRRYTIGGYADIQKRVNNEYMFFDESSALDVTERMNTFDLETIDNDDILNSLNRIKSAQGSEFLLEENMDTLNNAHMFDGLLKQPTPVHMDNIFGDRSLSRCVSVEKLFQDRKIYAQNVEHERRICKPCAHVYNGSTCMNGDDCAFCHHSDHELISAKKWKKLVKNNIAKLNLLLEVLREPNETNITLLNEVMKPNVKSGLKRNKKYMNSNNNSMSLNMNMNMDMNMNMNIHMAKNPNTLMYNNTFKPPFKHPQYNNYYTKPNQAKRMPRNGGYNFFQGNDGYENIRAKPFVGNPRGGISKHYNNVMPSPHVHI